jgi:hypothetical protein
MILALVFAVLAAPAGWHDTLPPAVAESERTGKPIFLVFRCDP